MERPFAPAYEIKEMLDASREHAFQMIPQQIRRPSFRAQRPRAKPSSQHPKYLIGVVVTDDALRNYPLAIRVIIPLPRAELLRAGI